MNSIAHIAIAVTDLDRAIAVFTELLGCEPSEVKEVINQGIKVAFFSSDAVSKIAVELLSPISDDCTVKTFLERRGEGLHHIAIRVSNVEKRLSELKEIGYRLIDEEPRLGAEGKNIAFIHPSSCSGVLIELVEE